MMLLESQTPSPMMLDLQSPKPLISVDSSLTPTSRSLKEANLDGSEMASNDTVPSSVGDDATHDGSGNTLKVREMDLDRETTDATLKLSSEYLPNEVLSNKDPSPVAQLDLPEETFPAHVTTNLSHATLHQGDPHRKNSTEHDPKPPAKDVGFFSFASGNSKSALFPSKAIEIRRHTSPTPFASRVSMELYHPKQSADYADLSRSRSRPSKGQERARSSLELYNLRRQLTQTSANAEINRMRNSIIVKRNIQRRRRDFLKEDQIYMGNKITEGHENFVMAYNMLTGIRVAVSRCSGVMKQLNDNDFRTTKKLTFNMDGSELTPSSKYDFKFKDYCPEVFRELRSLFGIDPADYLISITGKYILSELGSPGKSGSFFYYSRDYRFIIKTIHHSEHKQLRRMLKDYYDHVKKYPNTLISQFYGLHRLKVQGGLKKVHFIVMNNLFPPHRDIHIKYDLKGSTWGRVTPAIADSTDLSQVTLKDLNWLERGDKIKFGPEKRKFFSEQLEADVKLLKKINVMDYSLLLGVHDVKKGNTDTMQKLSVFDPKSNIKAEVIKTNPRDIDRGVDLPNAVFPGRSKYIFYGHDGGIRATNENNEPLPEIYYLGIIDCLTNYSMKKRLETFFRSMKHTRSTISAIPARDYGDRFIQFIKKGISLEKAKAA